jgi:DNA-binding LacI/PurR family transcriptional regulator
MSVAGGAAARRATIYDVARAAGVSHQTVAMVLRGQRRFRPETEERVRAAIAELDYRPNNAARALATSTPNRIGALVFELLEVGPSKTVQGASQRAAEAGYLLDIVSLVPHDDEAMDKALALLDRPDVAGILALAHGELSVPWTGKHRTVNVPVVAENQPDPGEEPTLHDRGMTPIVEHLVALGHRSMAYLGGPPSWLAARQREKAVRDALARHGLELVARADGDWSAASGELAVRTAELAGATALICGNDQMALGALLALARRGLDVPGDISVTGFDGIPESGFYRPPLTTVRVDYAAHGRRLVDELLALIPKARPVTEPVPVAGQDDTELVVRESTRAI